jgi:hypothetical protein
VLYGPLCRHGPRRCRPTKRQHPTTGQDEKVWRAKLGGVNFAQVERSGHSIKEIFMRRIPRKYGDFVFGVIQSGITSCIAAAIASFSFLETGHYLENWIASWLMSWLLMLPVVILAAPFIRRAVMRLTV